MATVELRDERGRLMAVLDPEARTVQIKCRRCTQLAGAAPVFHVFSVESGELIESPPLDIPCKPDRMHRNVAGE